MAQSLGEQSSGLIDDFALLAERPASLSIDRDSILRGLKSTRTLHEWIMVVQKEMFISSNQKLSSVVQRRQANAVVKESIEPFLEGINQLLINKPASNSITIEQLLQQAETWISKPSRLVEDQLVRPRDVLGFEDIEKANDPRTLLAHVTLNRGSFNILSTDAIKVLRDLFLFMPSTNAVPTQSEINRKQLINFANMDKFLNKFREERKVGLVNVWKSIRVFIDALRLSNLQRIEILKFSCKYRDSMTSHISFDDAWEKISQPYRMNNSKRQNRRVSSKNNDKTKTEEFNAIAISQLDGFFSSHLSSFATRYRHFPDHVFCPALETIVTYIEAFTSICERELTQLISRLASTNIHNISKPCIDIARDLIKELFEIKLKVKSTIAEAQSCIGSIDDEISELCQMMQQTWLDAIKSSKSGQTVAGRLEAGSSKIVKSGIQRMESALVTSQQHLSNILKTTLLSEEFFASFISKSLSCFMQEGEVREKELLDTISAKHQAEYYILVTPIVHLSNLRDKYRTYAQYALSVAMCNEFLRKVQQLSINAQMEESIQLLIGSKKPTGTSSSGVSRETPANVGNRDDSKNSATTFKETSKPNNANHDTNKKSKQNKKKGGQKKAESKADDSPSGVAVCESIDGVDRIIPLSVFATMTPPISRPSSGLHNGTTSSPSSLSVVGNPVTAETPTSNDSNYGDDGYDLLSLDTVLPTVGATSADTIPPMNQVPHINMSIQPPQGLNTLISPSEMQLQHLVSSLQAETTHLREAVDMYRYELNRLFIDNDTLREQLRVQADQWRLREQQHFSTIQSLLSQRDSINTTRASTAISMPNKIVSPRSGQNDSSGNVRCLNCFGKGHSSAQCKVQIA